MINRAAAMLASMAALLLFAGAAQSEEKEPSAIVTIGAAGEWGLREGGSSFGPATSVEVSAVKEWLEIEAGVGPFFGGGHTQWATPISSSRSPLRFPTELSSSSVLDRNGCIQLAAGNPSIRSVGRP